MTWFGSLRGEEFCSGGAMKAAARGRRGPSSSEGQRGAVERQRKCVSWRGSGDCVKNGRF